ncbi:hypothetical protein Tco_0945691 [Tanacetum coccineum]
MSNVSPQQYSSQSSTTPPSTHVPPVTYQPHFADNTQLDSGLSPTDNLIENLTNTLALLTQSYKTYLSQTNNQLRTSSNTRNQATVQDGKVVVQNVQGRQNRGGHDTSIDEDVDESPVQDLALNVDNVFQADECDAFDLDVNESPTAQTMFMANLSSTDPVYDEASPSYDSDILSKVHEYDNYQDAVCEHYEAHEIHHDVQPNCVVDSNDDYTSDSNMITYDQYVKDNAESVVQINASLTAELATYKEQVELYKRRAKFELTEKEQKIEEQLRIVITDRNIKEENLKKELYDSINITRAKHIKQTTALLTKNENLKAQIHENLKCITIDSVKPRVLALSSVETLREIVEEAKVERPLDRSLASACLYTKHSQELLEYVIGTCPKDFNKQDKKHASTPLTRKKQVTFEDQCETSNNNTHKHVEQLNIQKTNVPVIPSTGVNSCTDASGSKPRSNTKKNRISPAKSVNKKKVEEHPRTNKSSLKNTNHVDSSISSKRNVINLNSHSVCKTNA